jgi:hypothetical protein
VVCDVDLLKRARIRELEAVRYTGGKNWTIEGTNTRARGRALHWWEQLDHMVVQTFKSVCAGSLFLATMLPNYPGLLVLLSFLSTRLLAAGLDIRLPTGTFRGTSVPGSNVDKWLGIPFAQPPVGPLRFKAPMAITHHSSVVKNATVFGNACPQVPGNLGAPMGEDCLYLNVCYRPFDGCSF